MIGRRRLLVLTAGAAVGACSGTTNDSSRGWTGGTTAGSCATVAKGPGLGYCVLGSEEIMFPGAATLAVGEAMLRSFDDKTAAIVARDAGGFYALSAICTHACCTVSLCGPTDACAAPVLSPRDCADPVRAMLSSGGPAFLCPCHGSLFAADGTVTRGPAQRALPSVAVRHAGGDAYVDLSLPVSPETRS